jgi:hypothetical protein
VAATRRAAVPGRVAEVRAANALRALVGDIREAHDPAAVVLGAEDRARPSDLAAALAGRVTVGRDRSGRDRSGHDHPARALADRDPAGHDRAGRGSREGLPGRAHPAAGVVRTSMIDVLDSACMPRLAMSNRARRARRSRAARRIGQDRPDRVVPVGPAVVRSDGTTRRMDPPIGIHGGRTSATPALARPAAAGPTRPVRAIARPSTRAIGRRREAVSGPGRARLHPRCDNRGREIPWGPSSRSGPTRR